MDTRLIYFVIVFLQVYQAIIVLAAKGPKQCFDVLDKLSKYEVKSIYYMNFKELALKHPAIDIFTCFLHESYPQERTLTEQYFDVYEMCKNFEKTGFKPFGDEQLEELVSLGLPRYLEKDLRKMIETGNKKQLQEGIRDVENVMKTEIELSNDYKSFKLLVANKFKPKQ